MNKSNLGSKRATFRGDVWALYLPIIAWDMVFLCRDAWVLSNYIFPAGNWLWFVLQALFSALNIGVLAYPYFLEKLIVKRRITRTSLALSTLGAFFIYLFLNVWLYLDVYSHFCPNCHFS
jgi:hypothetical protein